MLSIGDLANSLTLRYNQALTKNRVSTHSYEVTTGLSADPTAHLDGDLGSISAIQADLTTLSSYQRSTTEASLLADATQRVLEDIQSATSDLGAEFLKVDLDTNANTRTVLSEASSQVFSLMADRLNTTQAGRSLFAGTATNSPALADESVIFTELRSLLSGAVTASDVEGRIDAWFNNSGGGFETFGYLGATTDQQPQLLNDVENVSFSLRGDNSVFRSLLKSAAMAVMADDASLGFSPKTKASLMRQAGDGLTASQSDLTNLRAAIGSAQGQIADAKERNDALYAALTISLSDILSVDGYEAATDLESSQTQLETIYAVTARQSRMSLVDYLR